MNNYFNTEIRRIMKAFVYLCALCAFVVNSLGYMHNYNKIRKFIKQSALTLVLLLICAVSSPAQNLTLPVYHLNIDPAFLDSLEANPVSSQTYPAELEYENETYPCQVRYRGGTCLNLPKRSWKIYFDSAGPQGQNETNLNAEYRDISICRNYLSMELSRFAGLPTPETRHISFLVNDVYRGVFLEVEQVDEEFLDSRNLGDGSMFKSFNHGARFAPPLFSEDISWFYEPKISTAGALDTLGARITFLQFADSAALNDEIDDILNCSNFLLYFTLQYCIRNGDGFTKNFYLHECDDGRYILIPWDCDATLGNDWLGNYTGGANQLDFSCLNHQGVFQRLVSIPPYREELLDNIDYIVAVGFDSIASVAVEVYDEIRNDVYQDTCKRGTNEEFDAELTVIIDWMSARTQYLTNLDWFHRLDVVESAVYPDYIGDIEDTIHFEARVTEPVYSVQLHIIDSLYASENIWLVDDGTSGDSVAGDLVYSINAAFDGYTPPFYYGFTVKSSPSEGYPTPPAGWLMFAYYPLTLPVIRLDDDPPLPDDIEIVDFSQIASTGTHYFGLLNSSGCVLNLTGCVARIGNSYRMLRLQEVEPLPPGDTLYVTNHVELMISMMPNAQVTGNLYFTPQIGDTVFLETSSGAFLASSIVESVNQVEEVASIVVINEINYNSAPGFDPQDWIEIYAREGNNDLSDWSLRDSRNDHIYLIPQGTILNEGEYLIIAANPEAFSSLFPEVAPVVGGFNFGFGGDGEEVRIFDDQDILIDCVVYDDEPPWPPEPDGDGPTLELVNPSLPNFSYENWRASTQAFPHGSPGVCNSVFAGSTGNEVVNPPDSWAITSAYPNPFNQNVRIKFSAPEPGLVRLSIFDLLGRKTASLEKNVPSSGEYSVVWNGISDESTPVSSGVYFIRLENSRHPELKKIVLLR